MSETGWTPLMFAARLGYTRIAKILIEHGAEAKNCIYEIAHDNTKYLFRPPAATEDLAKANDDLFLNACKQDNLNTVVELLGIYYFKISIMANWSVGMKKK